MVEEWRPIPSFEGWYEASRSGQIRRVKAACGTRVGKTLRPSAVNGGYMHVVLCRDGRTNDRLVHRLVAEAFLGPRPDGLDVNHIDGDKANNGADNLEYCTRGDNHRHAYRSGLKVFNRNQPRRETGQFVCAN